MIYYSCIILQKCREISRNIWNLNFAINYSFKKIWNRKLGTLKTLIDFPRSVRMAPLFNTTSNEKWTNFYVWPDKYLPFKLEFVLTLSPWRSSRSADDPSKSSFGDFFLTNIMGIAGGTENINTTILFSSKMLTIFESHNRKSNVQTKLELEEPTNFKIKYFSVNWFF